MEILRWRLTCRRFIRECSWDPHLRREGSRTGLRKEVSSEVISREASANTNKSSEAAVILQSCQRWGKMLYVYQPLDVGITGKGA